MRLTRANISRFQLPPGRADALLFDDDLPGFGLRVNAGGRKTWVAQFRIGGKQRRVALGTLDTVEPDEARKRAKAALGKVALGIDPASEKRTAQEQAAATFAAALPRYFAYAEARQRAGHHSETKRYLEKLWAPLAELPVEKITRATVSKRLGEIAKKHGPFASNRARAALSAFYTWALGEGVALANPVIGTHKATEEIARDRVLTEGELKAVWQNAAPADFRDIVQLLILTGARREEVGAMRWSEIGSELWTIAGERSKNGKAHDVPLSAQARAILDGRTRQDGRDLVFGSGAGPYQGWSNAKERLDLAMRGPATPADEAPYPVLPWRIHDIRRTVATRMADLGVLPHVVEAILNHVSGHKAGVAGIYNRSSYAAEKKAALTLWGDHVASLVQHKGAA